MARSSLPHSGQSAIPGVASTTGSVVRRLTVPTPAGSPTRPVTTSWWRRRGGPAASRRTGWAVKRVELESARMGLWLSHWGWITDAASRLSERHQDITPILSDAHVLGSPLQ